jgi:hypothetical protein
LRFDWDAWSSPVVIAVVFVVVVDDVADVVDDVAVVVDDVAVVVDDVAVVVDDVAVVVDPSTTFFFFVVVDAVVIVDLACWLRSLKIVSDFASNVSDVLCFGR